MIISRTPLRVSLFGGGTDYPDWYRRHGGATLVTTIDKYCYISCRKLPPFFDYKHRIVYSRMETVRDVSEICHPVVRAVLTESGVEEGLEIHHAADLPARTGLGSSSAFTVGLLHALHAFQGALLFKEELAREALRIEQEVLKEPVGSQDQVSTAYGGFNRLEFLPDGSFRVSPLVCDAERRNEFNRRLMLFFTGVWRGPSSVAQKKIENLHSCSHELHALRELVDDATGILASRAASLDDIGRLLGEGWHLKRSLAPGVTRPEIDEIYREGISAGALGGKVLGAGGGGFILFYVRPEDQWRVSERLRRLIRVRFKFDDTGSQILAHDQEASVRASERDLPVFMT
ncbi:MAG TPA: kinase [Bdellovibrionota bacterium]|nr:kinase [Bdellovibrionota bacterium]